MHIIVSDTAGVLEQFCKQMGSKKIRTDEKRAKMSGRLKQCVAPTHTPRSDAVNTGRRSEFIANSPLPGSAVVCHKYLASHASDTSVMTTVARKD